MRIAKTLLAGVLLPAALLLGACSSDEEAPEATGTPSASGTPDGDGGAGGGAGGGGGSDRECLIGTWALDVQDLANQIVTIMGVPGATATADGPVTVVFGEDIEVTWGTTLTVTMPRSEGTIEMTAVYTGSQVGTDWTATDGVIRATPGVNDLDVNMTVLVNGQAVPMDVPLPELGTLGSVDSTYTCSGDSATVTGPAPSPTWRLTRA
jgi:hypothetical protein